MVAHVELGSLSLADAERVRIRLMAAAGADSARAPDLDIEYTTERNVAIRYDDAGYPEDVWAMLFALEDGRVSNVVELSGTPRVFVKVRESGRRQLPFEDVQKTIYRDLFREKKSAYKLALIESLKQVYPMTCR